MKFKLNYEEIAFKACLSVYKTKNIRVVSIIDVINETICEVSIKD